MTNFQAQMFEMFSHKVVCVDSTHKTNPYGFKLVTIVVPDEFKNGKLNHQLLCSATKLIGYSCPYIYIQEFQLPGALSTEKMYPAIELSSKQ